MTACWDIMTSPGVWSALLTHTLAVTLPDTIMKTLTYLSPTPGPDEQECTWTSQPTLCPSTASPLTHSHTCTRSTPHSLSPSILGFMFVLTPLCPCARSRDLPMLQ